MGPGEVIIGIAVVVFLIVMINLAYSAFDRGMRFREKALELKSTAAAEDPRIARLEERVRVLERIATDRGQIASAELAARIEDLRTPERAEGAAA